MIIENSHSPSVALGDRDRSVRFVHGGQLLRAARGVVDERGAALACGRENGAHREVVGRLNVLGGSVILGMDGNMWTDPVDLLASDTDLEQPDVVGFQSGCCTTSVDPFRTMARRPRGRAGKAATAPTGRPAGGDP